jgi:hypothetical protein
VGAPPAEAEAVAAQVKQEIVELSRREPDAIEQARQKLLSSGANPEYAAEYEYNRRKLIESGMSPEEAAERSLYIDPEYRRDRRSMSPQETSYWQAEQAKYQEIADSRNQYLGEPTADYLRVWDTAQAKAALINSYIRAGVKPDESVEALLSKEISPYVSSTSQGGFNIDLVGAVQGGVNESTLGKVGISSSDVEKVRNYIKYQEERAREESKFRQQFKDSLDNMPQELQDAYAKGGMAGFAKSLDEYNERIQSEQRIRQVASDRLNEYRTPQEDIQIEGKRWVTKDGKITQYVRDEKGSWVEAETPEPLPYYGYKYDIVAFIKKNPTSESVQYLKDLGFPQETLGDCQKYVDAIRSTVALLDSSTTLEAISDGRINQIDLQGLDRAIHRAGVTFIEGSGRVTWQSLTEEQKQNVAGLYASDPYTKTGFTSFVGTLEMFSQEQPYTFGLLSAPITQVVAPFGKKQAGL